VRWSLSSFFTRWINTIPGLFHTVTIEPVFEISKYLIFLLFVLSIIYLIKTSKKTTWSFLVLIIFVTFLSLFLADTAFGSRYSSVVRFYLPTLIGILLTIAYLIGKGVTSNQNYLRQGSYILLVILLTLGIISKVPPTGGKAKFSGYGNTIPNAAAIVNQAEKPLVICEKWEDLFPLSYEAKDSTRYLLIRKLDDIEIKENYANIYLLSPSNSLWQEFEQAGIKLEKTENKSLWRINNPSSLLWLN
jgi:hypothetical protein